MSFDFNRAGQRYEAVAAGRQPGYGMLAREPLALMHTLQSQNADAFSQADSNGQRRLLDQAGCLHRLEGFMFQLSKVAMHATSLRRWSPPSGVPVPAPTAGSMSAIAADEACFDFEGLLLQARAALDRLTAFIARNHGQRCNLFTKLRPILTNVSRTDARAQATLSLLETAGNFDGVLVDSEDGATALRSMIAHYSSIPEGRQIAFTIHFISADRRLIFDCEAMGRPLFSTAEHLSIRLPFLVLNALAVYAGVKTLDLELFTLAWSNPTVSFSEYRTDDPNGVKFTVANMMPTGFSVTTHPLRPDVLRRAVPYP